MRITKQLALAATVAAALAVPVSAPALAAGPDGGLAPAAIDESGRASGQVSGQVAGRTYSRVKGSDRYETGVALSKAVYPKGVTSDGKRIKYVYVTSGQNFPDALAVGPLAGGRGPLLLVPKSGKLPKAVSNELTRLKRPDVIVFGGESTVSASMAKQLDSAAGTVYRVSGRNRNDTAAQVTTLQDKWLKAQFGVGVKTLYIANGTTYADALGASAAGANTKGGLLLTYSKSLPSETSATLRRVSPTKVYVMGGKSSVSPTVMAKIRAAAPNAKVVRISGSDRNVTAAKLSKVIFPTPSKVKVTLETTGYNYPDALAAAPLAWWVSAPVLLTRTSCLSRATNAEINRLAPNAVIAIGGGVSSATLSQKKIC